MNVQRAVGYNTGIAAEYFVLSQLYRLGLEAYVSLGNKKSIDIRVVLPNGKALTIDVKAVRSYSSLVMNNVQALEDHFIVCVIYKGRFEHLDRFPDVYVVPSLEIVGLLSRYREETRLLSGALDPRYLNNWQALLNA